MIEIDRSKDRADAREPVPVKIVGIGGAGSNALDRIVLDGMDASTVVALNTDVQSLTGSVASEKVQLGRAGTRGLGAGGDPEVGYAAAEEAANEIRTALEAAPMVFLCVGLGGGTGSGAAPVVARIAKELGALVVVVASMPFSFEGKRRSEQAAASLGMLEQIADAVICFENDRMGEAVDPKAGIHVAFASADQTISQSVRAICDMVNRPGLIKVGFDEISAALRNVNARSLFGYGEAEGDNRAHEALAKALKNPLMDKGRMLVGANNVLVNVVGGEDMTLDEVQIAMEELGRHISDNTRILFGTAVDPRFARRMSIMLLSSVGLGTAEDATPAETVPDRRNYHYEPEPVEEPDEAERFYAESEPEPVSIESYRPEEIDEPEPTMVAEEEPVASETSAEDAELIAAPPVETASRKKPQETQEVLVFEPVARGRFEKSEPTIVDGQDLDVPTYLRRNVRVK